ncbi:40S ribosomal protein S17-B, partial [Neolecta irregularis DAH-3]
CLATKTVRLYYITSRVFASLHYCDAFHTTELIMGRVRTKTVKRSSRVLIEKYYPKLGLDFHTNKKICDEVAIIASKRLRNKIAGFTTHLMKRIQKGPVRGISFKLQEEEREKKDSFVPLHSALEIAAQTLEVDQCTADMMKAMGVCWRLDQSLTMQYEGITHTVVPVAANIQLPERFPRRAR